MLFLKSIWIDIVLLGMLTGICSANVRCYTCAVDFRSEKFSVNNTCLFPKDHADMAHCSSNSKFCKVVITRVGGVLVLLQRSCAQDCAPNCSEKGFGIRIRECTTCCKDEPDCGKFELLKKK